MPGRFTFHARVLQVRHKAVRAVTGIPQGSPILPLLSNLYMRRFVLAWKKLGAHVHQMEWGFFLRVHF